MKTLQFKTNVNCGGCLAKITPKLNETAGIAKWTVDTANPMKVLTVETDELSAEEIQAIVAKAGYKAEQL